MSTWHVRPDTSHSGTRDGTSYATAWGGWGEIVWGGGGVVGGDTLNVYGTHLRSTSVAVGVHGATSEATRVTIRGINNAAMIFSGATYFENNRAWTTVDGLTIFAGTNVCIFVTDTAANSVYSRNILNANGAVAFSIYAINGEDHADIKILGNTFRGSAPTVGSGAAIAWFVSATSALSTLTRCTISENVFDGFSAGRAVIHLRTENDVDIGSKMVDLVIEGNHFNDCRGILIEANHGHATYGVGSGVRVRRNFANGRCLESVAEAGAGGFVSLRGFGPSANGTFGPNLVCDNTADSIQGAAGFANVFYGTYNVIHNEVAEIDTTTIDGCGLLFDHLAQNCYARGNKFKRILGKAGVAKSGVGIMVLDATNIVCEGNIFDDCLYGIHFGDSGGGQSCTIRNNVFIGVRLAGVYATASAALGNCAVHNNHFAGDGYSVQDLSAVSWTAENYNNFYGFALGTLAHTLGGNDTALDAQLDADYLPRTEALMSAGTPIAGMDFYGKPFRLPTPIGAVQPSQRRGVNNLRGLAA